MLQTTTKFKVTLATLLALIAILGLAFNQLVLLRNQQTIDDRLTTLSKHIISIESPAPTASPSAAPAVNKTFFVPAKPVTTVAPTLKK